MQSYLTAIISSIKKRATEKGGDIDSQAFWLANTYRLYCDMKQFSGDKVLREICDEKKELRVASEFKNKIAISITIFRVLWVSWDPAVLTYNYASHYIFSS